VGSADTDRSRGSQNTVCTIKYSHPWSLYREAPTIRWNAGYNWVVGTLKQNHARTCCKLAVSYEL
jgi:hypothetical protein